MKFRTQWRSFEYDDLKAMNLERVKEMEEDSDYNKGIENQIAIMDNQLKYELSNKMDAQTKLGYAQIASNIFSTFAAIGLGILSWQNVQDMRMKEGTSWTIATRLLDRTNRK